MPKNKIYASTPGQSWFNYDFFYHRPAFSEEKRHCECFIRTMVISYTRPGFFCRQADVRSLEDYTSGILCTSQPEARIKSAFNKRLGERAERAQKIPERLSNEILIMGVREFPRRARASPHFVSFLTALSL